MNNRPVIVALPMSELHSFKNHPFQVKQGTELEHLAESIKENGVLTPAIVRPRKDGGYELLSGHRRKAACELAGLKKLPVIVRDVDDDTAILMMVDSNRQRENLLPSEKAFSYKMRLDAMKRQCGRSKENGGQVDHRLKGQKSRDILAADCTDSAKQIERFIRLTYLVKPILNMVDERKMAFNPAVELSYLPKETQRMVLDWMDAQQATPSLAQAKQLKAGAAEKKLMAEDVEAILSVPKANQREKIMLQGERFAKFFPRASTPRELEDAICRVLEERQRRLARKREEAER